MRIALAAVVMLLAGCTGRQHAAYLDGPVTIGKTTEPEIASRLGAPLKSVTAPNGAKNETYPFQMISTADPANAPNATTYIFGLDGVLRHIIMETSGGARYLLHESNTDGILPGEIVGPMPTAVAVTIRRVQ